MRKIENDTIKNYIKILSDLKKYKVLTITKADKGNTIVIMDTDDYHYLQKKMDFDPTDKYVKSIRKELESWCEISN